jgi:predicted transcriptional regulator of viral defense system
MSFDRFRRDITTDIFDYQLLASYFGDLKKMRDKASSLVAEGKIIRLKKGLYLFGEDWRRSTLHLEVIANLLYGPSCISFEYALGGYGLIAERSQIVTSLTIGDSKVYQTPVGQFEYRAVSAEKFKIGIEYRSLGEAGGYFIASREKALADLVYRTPGIRTLGQLTHYLFEEMRVDESMFRALDFKHLREIAKIYNKNSVSMLEKI